MRQSAERMQDNYGPQFVRQAAYGAVQISNKLFFHQFPFRMITCTRRKQVFIETDGINSLFFLSVINAVKDSNGVQPCFQMRPSFKFMYIFHGLYQYILCQILGIHTVERKSICYVEYHPSIL